MGDERGTMHPGAVIYQSIRTKQRADCSVVQTEKD